MLDPPQSGSRSPAAIQLLLPIWSNRRKRGTVYALDRGRAPNKLGKLIVKYRDERAEKLT